MLRKYARAFVAPQWPSLIWVVLLALTASLLSAADPVVLKYLFDSLEHRDVVAIPLMLGLLLLVEVVRAALTGLVSVRAWDLRLAVDLALRDRLLKKLTSASADYHQAENVGGMMNRISMSVTSYTTALAEIVLTLIPSLAYLGIAAVVMWRLNWKLALVTCAFAPLAPLIGAWAAKEQTSRERRLMDRWTQIYSRLNEVLSGIRLVKIFAMEHAEHERFVEAQKEGNEIVAQGLRTDARTGWARSFSVALARLGAIAFGASLIIKGEITVGSLVAFLGYVGGMLVPVQGLTTVYQTLRKGSVAVETIQEIFDSPAEQPDRPDAHTLEQVRGELRFEDVTFAHARGPKVLQHFNLAVQPGERVALVGPSGSGKTTLTNLLLRLYPLGGGRICIDGHDINQLTAQSLRRNIAYVAQDIHLFNDTVRANIAYARPTASEEEIVQAARWAHAHEFISELSEGYDTVVGERGGRLSGGQRQRLAIARAILKNAPILVMDEATSALDALSESVVQESLDHLSKGRTTLFAAHRLSTVIGADRIVVLEGGRILASGTHRELLATSPYYSGLVGASTGGLLALDRALPLIAST